MNTWALFSLKGGVGKTAAAVNLAYEAALGGQSVLLWDLDPQGAASWYLGRDRRSQLEPARLIAGKQPPGRAVVKTGTERLSLLPASPDFRDWDVALHATKKPRKALERLVAPFAETYSLLILDSPPNQGALATAVLGAAGRTLVPTVPSPLSLRALDAVFELVARKNVGRAGVTPFFSLVDRRRKAHRELLQSPPKTLAKAPKTIVDYSTHVEQMGEHRQPVRMFAPKSRAARQFRDLDRELRAAKG